MFYSGQRVVCITNEYMGVRRSNRPWLYRFPHIRVGDIYTVRKIKPPRYKANDYVVMIMGRERTRNGQEIGFPASCFRPLCDKTTDISELQKLLLTKENVNVE